MKIKDLLEMPIKIGAFPDYDDRAINFVKSKLGGAEVIELVEGKFELIARDDFYGLRYDGELLGFAKTGVVEYFEKKYRKIKMIFVIPEERRNKIGHKLLLGIKETSEYPIMCDDVISELGFNLFNSYPFNQWLKSLNVDSGIINDFKAGDEMKPKVALILENKTIGLWRQNFLPESAYKDYLIFSFDDGTKE